MIERTRQQWEKLGESDPYWAVLTNPKMKNDRWDRDAFFASGEKEFHRFLRQIHEADLAIHYGTALDFGCGVGRLSRPLAAKFDQVTAVDISNSMLAEAKSANQHIDNITFIHNTEPNLHCIPDSSVDFILSSKVLQHMRVHNQQEYLRDFCRILRPGGIMALEVHTNYSYLSLRGWFYFLTGPRTAPFLHLLGKRIGKDHPLFWMDMHPLSRRKILAILRQENIPLVAREKHQAPRNNGVVHERIIAQKAVQPT